MTSDLPHHHRITFRQRRPQEPPEVPVSAGARAADRVAAIIGSWRFIGIQSAILGVWIVLNAIGWRERWDPYPFILLNLMLSFQAAYSAPIIMMSQNRQAEKDRIAAAADYQVNTIAESQILEMFGRLDHLGTEQWEELLDIQRRQLELLEALSISMTEFPER